MATKLGSTDVSFRLGATTPAAVYLGSEQVWSAATVPDAPSIVVANYNGSSTAVSADASSLNDGGSPITGFKWYIDGVEYIPDQYNPGPPFEEGIFNTDFSGQEAQVSAVNAIGEGQKSAPFTVTAA